MIILMLLENKLFTNKSQNPTSKGETAGNNAENLWSPILFSYSNLIKRGVTQVNREQIYGSPRQQINQPVTTPECEPFPMNSIQIPFAPINPEWDLDHHQVGTWTLKCKRWNRTTEIIISPSFEFQDKWKFVIFFLSRFWYSNLIFGQFIILIGWWENRQIM